MQTDGQLKTGRDVAIACLLGAEEFGFATTALVAEGCVMMRVCHIDTCPVGVATQNPELRKKFTGKPEYVENFMMFVAEEVREIMAELGFRSLNEMVGHSELLDMNEAIAHWKAKDLDFSPIFYKPPHDGRVYCFKKQDHGLEKSLDRRELLAISHKSSTAATYSHPSCVWMRHAPPPISDSASGLQNSGQARSQPPDVTFRIGRRRHVFPRRLRANCSLAH